MSAPLPSPPRPVAGDTDQYIVTHGKSGVIGVFTRTEPGEFPRGTRVVVRTERGVELGTVLGPATIHQARLFGSVSCGLLIRSIAPSDEARLGELAGIEQGIFDLARRTAVGEQFPVDVLDVEVLFDGQLAVVQFLGDEARIDPFARMLEESLHLTIRFENLAGGSPQPEKHADHRCEKPDCGREGAGGCTTCSTGGGCSSCGSGRVDLREVFGHLRSKMERRIPLA